MIKRFFKDFGIQSRLAALVSATTLARMLLTGLLDFWASTSSMQQAGYRQLTSFRNDRAEAIREHLEQLGNHIMATSEVQIAIDGLQAFAKACNKLSDIDDNQKTLISVYESSLVPRLIKYLCAYSVDAAPRAVCPRQFCGPCDRLDRPGALAV
jgi:hypothetical protein